MFAYLLGVWEKLFTPSVGPLFNLLFVYAANSPPFPRERFNMFGDFQAGVDSKLCNNTFFP